jgi:transcriptional regulator with PAS, ATPase and Fis domain
MRVYEKAHIQSVLAKADHDKKQAADLLGVSLSSLYRKIEELEIT